jgi:hypothetical protein
VGKPEGKRPLGRTRCRRVDNIKMNLGKMEWGCIGCNDLAKNRDWFRAFVYAVMNLRVL